MWKWLYDRWLASCAGTLSLTGKQGVYYENNGYYKYKPGDKLKVRNDQIVGYGFGRPEYLVLGIDEDKRDDRPLYVLFTFASKRVEYHFKWNLEHQMKRIKRNDDLRNYYTIEEMLTHEDIEVRECAKKLSEA